MIESSVSSFTSERALRRTAEKYVGANDTLIRSLERETGFEPATLSLEG